MKADARKLCTITMILLLLLLQACTFRSLILNYTDTFLISEIESALEPISDKQEEIIKKQVNIFWKNMRCIYIKDMEKDFEKINTIITTGITEQSIETLKLIIKKWRNTLFTKSIDLLAKLKPSLKEAQISTLKRKFVERTDEIKETLNLDPDEYQEVRKEKILENFETFYGQATEQQQTRLFLIYGLNRSREEIRLENRKYFNDFFINTLVNAKGSKELNSGFADWINNPAIAIPPAKRAAYLRFRNTWYQRLITTDRLITKQQRLHLINFISELKQDLLKQVLPTSECKS
ncbi:MAG: DUF6279 family lipoprotein [Oligoflexales bacterium]